MAQPGLLIVISGPSGTGKGTVCQALMKECPNLHYSISVTTRQPRFGEQEGINYYFVNTDTFHEMIKNNELLEWAEVYGNYYGTPLSKVNEMLTQGKNVLLEIDTQGAMKVKETFSAGLFVFLLPPSLQELSDRIHKRGTDTEEVIAKRLSCAVNEVAYAKEYDYVLVNDNVQKAVNKIKAILIAEPCRVKRSEHIIKQLQNETMI